jgi:septal ring factor EnvC (AmiA/AmiB activator)
VIDLLCQPESENAQVVKSTKPDDRRLKEELASTTEQLRLVEHEVLTLRRDLDQAREQVQKVATHATDLETDYRVKLREAEDARRASETNLVHVVDQLCLQSLELKLSRAGVEASHFKCSQITFLSAALQERIYELEAEAKTRGVHRSIRQQP